MRLKIGIDSYCYHRFFGEVYPQQDVPDGSFSLEDFLKRAKALEVDGVSLESCFIPQFDKSYLSHVKSMLDDYGFDRVFAWGHPDGLEAGANEKAFDEMLQMIEHAHDIGAKVMRVVGSSLMFRFADHGPQLEKLADMFKQAVKVAERYDIKLAVENHIDYNSDEFLKLLEDVDSPYLGLNFDSGNFLRVQDDPIDGIKKLAKYTYATHIKDLLPVRGANVKDWFFFSCTPIGQGLVDNKALAKVLLDSGYEGFFAVEMDMMHPDYWNQEDSAVAESMKELRRIGAALNREAVQ